MGRHGPAITLGFAIDFTYSGGPSRAIHGPTPAGTQYKLAVMPLGPVRIDAGVATLLTDIVTNEVGHYRMFQVISAGEINAMLGMEKMKEAVGCNDVACAAEIGGALGSNYMLAGTVGRLGSKLTISLSLFDIHEMKVVTRARSTVDNNEDLFEQGMVSALRDLLSGNAR